MSPHLGWAVALADPVTRERAAAAARRELARPEYHQDDPSLLQRIVTWISERIGGAIARTTSTAPGGPIGLLIIAALVVLVVVLVRVRLGKLPVRDLLGDRTPGARGRSARDYRAEADRLAAEGQWAEALRARTRAVVHELEARGVVEPRPGATASGIAREAARGAPAAREDVTLVARLFEEVWYGGRHATEGDVSQAREADARLQRTRLTVPPAAEPAALAVPR